MKLSTLARTRDPGGRRPRERGTAILVVMMLLLVITAITLANVQTLRHLTRELRQIDREQMEKYEPRPGH